MSTQCKSDDSIWATISSTAMIMVCNNEKVENSVSQFQNIERENNMYEV